jgi:oxygen-independent coproporphyrinogen-3 oxidase
MEYLTDTQKLNEYIMTSLRTLEGISLKKITAEWGDEKVSRITNAASKHIDQGHLMWTVDVLQLTATGKFLADGIAADLFEG